MEETLTLEQLPKAVTSLTKEIGELKKLLIEKNEQQPAQPTEKLLTIQQAAEFLNLKVPTVYTKVSKGKLPVMKRGKLLYFSSTELMTYIKDGRKKSFAQIEAEVDAYLSQSRKGGRYGNQ